MTAQALFDKALAEYAAAGYVLAGGLPFAVVAFDENDERTSSILQVTNVAVARSYIKDFLDHDAATVVIRVGTHCVAHRPH